MVNTKLLSADGNENTISRGKNTVQFKKRKNKFQVNALPGYTRSGQLVKISRKIAGDLIALLKPNKKNNFIF